MSITTKTPEAAPKTNTVTVKATPNATADNAVFSGAKQVSSLEVDNSLNTSSVYFKLYDNAAPTVGTTPPDEIIFARAGKVRRVNYSADELEVATAMSWACVTAGGTGGTTAPANTVTLRLTAHDP